MRVSVFGLGYVGSVSATCLASLGHEVVGVDVNPAKVRALADGTSPIVEPGLDALIGSGIASGRLRATVDGAQAVAETEISLVCVGTPSGAAGDVDLRFVGRVVEEIGAAVCRKPTPHVVALRSTLLPGTTEDVLVPILERASGRRLGDRLSVAYNPEFMREGTAVDDFFRPSRTIVGADGNGGDVVVGLYADVAAPLLRTDVRTAEMAKYADNAFHALKVAFANEIGVLAKAQGVDARELFRLFLADAKLNVSAAYLRPGYAFGGSCLPKDLRALVRRARVLGVDAPLIESVTPSNERHKLRALEMVEATGKRRVAVIGLSFKPGTDDLRESAVVDLVEMLIGRGYRVSIYDPNIILERLTGVNRAFVFEHLPHVGELLKPSLEDAVREAEVVVVTQAKALGPGGITEVGAGRFVVDLAGTWEAGRAGGTGIAW